MSVISVIIPTLNEEAQIERTLAAIEAVRGKKQVIVADGGSRDGTAVRAHCCGARVIHAPCGRGPQMHAATRHAIGDVLWFIHADTLPSTDAIEAISGALKNPLVAAGNFRLRFDGDTPLSRQLTAVYPWLRLLGLSYGDSGIFVRRTAYDAVGGFRPLKLFEDVDLVRRIRAFGRFVHLPSEIVTSSRRFENRGPASMWTNWIALQLLFWAGFHPNTLARWYTHVRR